MKSRTAGQVAVNQALPSEAALRPSEQQLLQELDAALRLHEVSTQLIQADDVQAIFDKLLDTLVAVMGADYASVQMLDPSRGPGGELQLLGHRGFPDEASQFWRWVRPTSQCACGIALRTGRRVIVPDIETCDSMAGSADLATCRQAGIRAIQTTPLLSRSGSILGMISTHWRKAHEPSERELQLLDILARQAAELIERLRSEAALREERFRLLADQAPVLIWMSDSDKLCTWFNKPWLEFVGRTMEQELGNGWFESVHPGDFGRRRQTYAAAFAVRRPFSMEYRLKRRDGEYRWMLDNGIPRYGANGEFAGYIGSCTDINDRKALERDIVEIASLERQRIGQDLHDDIGQELTALALLADGMLERLSEESPENIALAQRIVEASKRTLGKVRSLARGLAVAEVEPDDLPASLAELAKRLGESSKVRCAWDLDPNVRFAGSLEPTHLYHIAQEACNNSLKHACAGNLEISLQHDESAVLLQVRDDGIGMPAEPPAPAGLGLRIMHNRAAIIGAQLTIEPAAPKGTLVACRLARGIHEPG